MKSQVKYRALPVAWALFGALMAGIIGVVPLLPGLLNRDRKAALAGVVAIASGALIGAAAGLLYQRAGRLRFWVIACGLGMALLAYAVICRGLTSAGTLGIVFGAVVAIGLSLWVLLAYGLSVWRRRKL